MPDKAFTGRSQYSAVDVPLNPWSCCQHPPKIAVLWLRTTSRMITATIQITMPPCLGRQRKGMPAGLQPPPPPLLRRRCCMLKGQSVELGLCQNREDCLPGKWHSWSPLPAPAGRLPPGACHTPSCACSKRPCKPCLPEPASRRRTSACSPGTHLQPQPQLVGTPHSSESGTRARSHTSRVIRQQHTGALELKQVLHTIWKV